MHSDHSTLGLVGVRGSARGGMVGVLTDLDEVSMFPAGGGAVRGPGRATVPYPEQVVNVRRGFGGNNVWICLLDGGKGGRRRELIVNKKHAGAENGSCMAL